MTVVLTTHYIEEAENLCNRVAILNKGKLIKLDTPNELCRQLGKYVVEWTEKITVNINFLIPANECAQFASTLDTSTTIPIVT